MKIKLRRKMSALIFRPLILWMLMFFAAGSYAQEMRALSQTAQERIGRLEELAQYYINRDDFQHATSYLNQISYTYWENQRPDMAAATFKRTIPFYEKLNDLENLHKIYSNIGLIYLDLENIEEADRAFTKNLEVQRQTQGRQGIATALVDLAYVKNLRRDHREAILLLEEALEISLAIGYETVLPNIYQLLASSYTDIGNTRRGDEFRSKYADMRDHITRQTMRGEFQVREEESQIQIMRSQIEARARKAEMELQEIMFKQEQDSVQQVIRQREDSLELASLRAERQMVEIQRMGQEADLASAEIERQLAVQNFQQLIIYSVLGGLALVMILVILMLRSNIAKKRANKQLAAKNLQIEKASVELQDAFEKIEEQNFRITQSISYAREIQRALFPPIETLSNFLPDSFIFFKPVDMVSGDFYWFREAHNSKATRKELTVNTEVTADGETNNKFVAAPQTNGNNWLPFNSEKFIISAVDCTGHGVPGAFMSMIGYNLLDSITDSGTTHPDRILGRLHTGVRQALKQEETTNRDGMDIAMCVINNHDRTVEFAGANNPVFYITNGELNMIKGDMNAIGGSQKKTERKYKGHTIKVEAPTSFYILTDGYTDQFGGEDGMKFSMKNFKELLMNIYQQPMKEQKILLEEHFINWKGKEEQIDDVLVIGFKLE